jgi:tetratricopeptide (TPR) repeat protein
VRHEMPKIEIDIRAFRRYPRDVSFTLKLKGKAVAARVVDCSFNGLGMLIEESATLNPGDVLDLNVDELDTHQKGKVIWVTRFVHGTRAGITKLGRLSGIFTQYRLSDILIGLQRTLKTGILDIRHGYINKKIYIKNGDMIYAASNQREDWIGGILPKEGKITRAQWNQVSERKNETNERYVMPLLEAGLLKPSDLFDTVKLQATRIIESLFALQDSKFQFIEEPLPFEAITELRISAGDLIYREVKKTADDELIKKYLLDAIVDFSSTPLNLFQDIRLEQADSGILSYVDGKMAIRDLMRLSPLDEKETLRCLYALLQARIIEIREKGATPQGIRPEEVYGKIDEAYCKLIEKIDEMHSKYRNLDHYDLLGISKSATSEEIKKAYFKAAKEFHPDRHFGLPGDIKEKLVDIFISITNAYRILKNDEKRLEYSRSLKRGTVGAPMDSEMATGFQNIEKSYGKANSHEALHSRDLSRNAEIAANNFEEGKSKFRKKKFEDAAQFFASAIYFNSSRPEYHFYYGFALEELGKLKEALQSMNRAFEMSPSSADIIAGMGQVYLKLGCPLRAKGSFERALKLQPSNKEAQQGIKMIKKQDR